MTYLFSNYRPFNHRIQTIEVRFPHGMIDLPECDSEIAQYSCEFWIYNFRYEIFYDLKKRCRVSDFLDEPEEMDITTNENYIGAAITALPTEMISRVFTFLTATDLLVVRDVCQQWRDIVEQDKSLWNHAHFSSTDLDVKTTISLLKEMPLLRSIELCNVHSADDMTRLITALCHACWDLRQIYFPDICDWHPSSIDLHQLNYYHPCIASLHIATKQKLTPVDIANIGCVLQDFSHLQELKLVGFYWQQSEIIPELLAKLPHLYNLSLPSLPGLNGVDIKELQNSQQNLYKLTINTSSLTSSCNKKGPIFSRFFNLKVLRAIDSSSLTTDKLALFESIDKLTHLEVNLSNSRREEVTGFFKKQRLCLVQLKVSNCEYSDELLECLGGSCTNLRTLVWVNPKDATGEVTDVGILAITKLPLLHTLEIKSRSVSKTYYPNLAALRNLKYARINGMRVPGCL